MTISSRTPEGTPSDCPVCGHHCMIGPVSAAGDALCPNCGSLLWIEKRATGMLRDARSRIIAIVDGIARLSKAPIKPAVMLNGFSQGVVHVLGAKACAVWEVEKGGIENRFTYPEAAPEVSIVQHELHAKILLQHAKQHTRDSMPGDCKEMYDDKAEVRVLLLLCSFTCATIPIGVVEVFQRYDTPVAARPGFIAFLAQAVKLLENSVALNIAA